MPSLHGAVQSMHSGKYTIQQIGYDADHNELYRLTGQGTLSLAWIHSQRILAGSIGLNVVFTLLSTINLIVVSSRRFELFSFMSLLLYTAISAAVCSLEIWCVMKMQQMSSALFINEENWISGIIVLQIVG